jgi:RNA polymerase sigma-70 factor (ECF subfamily)
MVSIWRKAGQFDLQKRRLLTWIFTIARNLAIDRFRKSRGAVRYSDPAFVPDDPLPPDRLIEQLLQEPDHGRAVFERAERADAFCSEICLTSRYRGD